MQSVIKLDSKKEFPVMGVKVIGNEYANEFVEKGIVHFSNPKTWRDKSLCNGKQLDEDEGCFCFSTEQNDLFFESIGRKIKKYRTGQGWKYFEDNDLILGTCFYGILRSNFSNGIMQYGVRTIQTQDMSVPRDYFKEFNDSSSTETKKTIIILDFYKFYERMIDTLIKMGASKEDIHVSTVYYVNKKVPFCTTEPFPFEFFLKDDEYSKQSELRFIIASKNKSFYKSISKNHNNIEIGDISSIAVIQDYYNEDLDFSIQGDKLIYRLAKPITLTMDERTFAQLVAELYQIKQNLLPGEAKDQYELDVLAQPIIEHLAVKYNVEFRDDWRLYNVPRELVKTLPDVHREMCYSIIDDELV